MTWLPNICRRDAHSWRAGAWAACADLTLLPNLHACIYVLTKTIQNMVQICRAEDGHIIQVSSYVFTRCATVNDRVLVERDVMGHREVGHIRLVIPIAGAHSGVNSKDGKFGFVSSGRDRYRPGLNTSISCGRKEAAGRQHSRPCWGRGSGTFVGTVMTSIYSTLQFPFPSILATYLYS